MYSITTMLYIRLIHNYNNIHLINNITKKNSKIIYQIIKLILTLSNYILKGFFILINELILFF